MLALWSSSMADPFALWFLFSPYQHCGNLLRWLATIYHYCIEDRKTSLMYRHLLPDLAAWLTLIGSNYPCVEQVSMFPKMFEPLKFDNIFETVTKIQTQKYSKDRELIWSASWGMGTYCVYRHWRTRQACTFATSDLDLPCRLTKFSEYCRIYRLRRFRSDSRMHRLTLVIPLLAYDPKRPFSHGTSRQCLYFRSKCLPEFTPPTTEY